MKTLKKAIHIASVAIIFNSPIPLNCCIEPPFLRLLGLVIVHYILFRRLFLFNCAIASQFCIFLEIINKFY